MQALCPPVLATVFLVAIGCGPFEAICESFQIQPKTWRYKGNPIAYEEARCKPEQTKSTIGSPEKTAYEILGGGEEKMTNEDEAEPVLLLNGFGVGSFHQHRLIPHLLKIEDRVGLPNGTNVTKSGKKRTVYGVDYLGQGKSWPENCNDGNAESERGLRYCINMWADQIIAFVEDVIVSDYRNRTGKNDVRIHVAGNSVGGHLAVVLALKRPDLVCSVTLLNATPVWGLNLPGWSGHLPPPAIPRRIGRYLFDRIRDERTIETYLDTAYANRQAFDDDLVHRIKECTDGPGGHAAFASILWSPPVDFPETGTLNFSSMLSKLQCDVLLIFGKNDPWCKPAFARKMLKALSDRGQEPEHKSDASSRKLLQRYVELDNVGHCPNHEAPQAVGKVLTRWFRAHDRRKDQLSLVHPNGEIVNEPWGQILIREIEETEEEDGFACLLDKILTRMVG